jgi:hypothetical protein
MFACGATMTWRPVEFDDDAFPLRRHLWKLICAIDDDDTNTLLSILPACIAAGYKGLINTKLFENTQELGPVEVENDNQRRLRGIFEGFQLVLRHKTRNQSFVQIIRRSRKCKNSRDPDPRNLEILILGTIFNSASLRGRVNIVECLLADTYCCPVSKTDKRVLDAAFNFQNAIIWASEAGYVRVVKLLLGDRRVDPSVKNCDALCRACKGGHVDVVKLLLTNKRVDPSASNDLALQFASEQGHVDVVKVLLADNRVDPTVSQSAALRLASRNGHTEITKVLLAYSNTRPSRNDSFIVRFATWKGYDSVANKLMKRRRVDPAADNNYAIRYAAGGGHLEVRLVK